MPPRLDLTGQIFGRLTVQEFSHVNERKHTCWTCTCSCGTTSIVQGSNLKTGSTLSCGCLRITAITTHGMRHTATYKSWARMIERCENSRHISHPRYGERGIVVCRRWRQSFESFFADMGEKPEGTSLDRIDNDGNYCPENSKWSTRIEQANNKRNNVRITIEATTHTAAEWSQIMGFKRSIIYSRLRRGWPPEKAVLTRVSSHEHPTTNDHRLPLPDAQRAP